MEEIIKNRIERAKELLHTVRHAAIATVNADGTPHNTPIFFLHDNTLQNIYWCSQPESLHSQNAIRTGDIFVVLYEGNTSGGLYIKASQVKELSGMDLENALSVHNAMREREGKAPIPLSYYATGPQRMYSAQPIHIYVNVAERGEDGYVIKEWRHEITLDDLKR